MGIDLEQKSIKNLAVRSSQLLDLYIHGRTTLRYRQLAVGILMTVATGYISPVLGQLQAQSINNISNLSSTVQLNGIRPTNNGLMLTVNANPQIRIQRENNPERLIVDLQNTNLAQALHQSTLPMNRLGIKQVRVAQFQNNPAIARLVLDLDSNDPNSKVAWQGQYIASTRTLLLTPSNQTAQAIPIAPPINPNLNLPRPINSPTSPVSSTPTEIQSLSFSNTGQLIISANQPVSYRANFDPTSGTYTLTITNAKISPNLQRPSLATNSPIERIRLSQVGNSVEIGIKTISGWQLRETQRLNNQQIQLQVSLNSVAPNNQTPLPSNNPVPQTPLNTGERRRGVILVDAGHGGRDPGAIGNGIQEKDVVLDISISLGKALQNMGYTVYYTRTSDVEIDLEPRVALAERVNADVFVSIHANSLASRNNSVNGVETFFARGSTIGRTLASYVQSQIISATGATDRSAKAAGFYVIARTSMPAILVETGFVTNPTEARNLSNPNYQKQMADAIARGIDQFMRVRGR
ncbi:N-acetylmuramoyl-L-alanine amidase [Pseudanabaena minima]|uniref:N-acetylmuramoyl-L-alanine amidase n=1 Tax=Pseudanabaena minima TaxID=890415 RepID=UPI003DAA1683